MTLDIGAWNEVERTWAQTPPEVFVVEGSIDLATGHDLRAHALVAAEKKADLLVFIESTGGNTIVGIRASKDWFPRVRKQGGRVMTIAMGRADSTASHLLVAGDEGYRFAHEEATMSIHGGAVECGAGRYFGQNELEVLRGRVWRRLKGLKGVSSLLGVSFLHQSVSALNRWQVKHYDAHTFLTRGDLREMCLDRSGTQFTAAEAQKMGIIDQVGLPSSVMKHYYEATKDQWKPVICSK